MQFSEEEKVKRRARSRAYYWKNREKILARKVLYHKRTAATKAEYGKKYREENAARLLESYALRKEQRTEAGRKWRQANRNKHAAYQRKSAYGITQEQYDCMLEKQACKCSICKRPREERRLCVDHCHDSGKFRGLLCSNCNRAIGLLGEDPKTALAAYEYLFNEGT